MSKSTLETGAGGKFLLVSDVDDTLLGDDASLRDFAALAGETDYFAYALNSSRPIASVQASLAALPVRLRPVAIIGAMGTEIMIDGQHDSEWQDSFAGWDRSVIDEAVGSLGAVAHAEEFQTPFKASYEVPETLRHRVRAAVEASGQPTRMVISGTTDFDILPPAAGKGPATMRVLQILKLSRDQVIVAGDSANDIDLFNVSDRGILVGNARAELRAMVDPARAYAARNPRAAGIIEGLHHWGVITYNKSAQVRQ